MAKRWRALTVLTNVDPPEMPLLERSPSDDFTIVAMVEGACRIESRCGRSWQAATFTTGDVGMTVPGKSVRLRWHAISTQPLRTVHISLPVAAFERYAAEESKRELDLDQLDVLSMPDPVISAVAMSLARADEGSELHAESAAQYLVAHLLQPQVVHMPEGRALTDRQLTTVIDYMRANLGCKVMLDDLARSVALSRFHFLRLFTATTGRSPIQFLTDLRINTARQQLASSDEPVGQIGRRTGFGNASHFTATFTQHVGCTPTAYRQRTRS